MEHQGQHHPSADAIGTRSTYLQSLRGLAALAVAIGHCFTTMQAGRIDASDFTLTAGNAILATGQVLFQSNTAVIFFYVLSGLVLGESLRRHAGLPVFRFFGGFVVRRLFRLYPVAWASVALAAIVLLLAPDGPFQGVTDAWFNAMLRTPVTPESVLLTASGLAPDSVNINTVLWSVRIELLIIPVLPWLVLLSLRTSAVVDILIVAGLVAFSLYLCTGAAAPLDLPRYLYCFYLGVALPKLIRVRWLSAATTNPWVTLGAVLLLLPIDFLYYRAGLEQPVKFVGNTIISAQVLGFVIASGSDRSFRWLAARPLVWIGNVSFSFYASSLIVQIGVASLLLAPFSEAPSDWQSSLLTIAISVLTVAVTLALAWPSYRYIEVPLTKAGRRVSQRIERSASNRVATTTPTQA